MSQTAPRLARYNPPVSRIVDRFNERRLARYNPPADAERTKGMLRQ